MPQLAEGPSIVTDNLVFYADFKNRKCYPGTGTTINDLSRVNGTSVDSVDVQFVNDYLRFLNVKGYIEFNKNLLTHNNNEISVTILITKNIMLTDLPIYSLNNEGEQLGWGLYFEYTGLSVVYSLFINSRSLLVENNYINYKCILPYNFSSEEVLILTYTYKRNPTTTEFTVNCYVNDKKVTDQLTNNSFLPVQGQYQYDIFNHNKLTLGNNLYFVVGTSTGRQYGNLVYNRALTDAEVLQNHKSLRGRYQQTWR